MHRRPVAFVPFLIRWGPVASSDLLRRSARCGRCGAKGAALQDPSWGAVMSTGNPFHRPDKPVGSPAVIAAAPLESGEAPADADRGGTITN
jgi:hypothetical protein